MSPKSGGHRSDWKNQCCRQMGRIFWNWRNAVQVALILDKSVILIKLYLNIFNLVHLILL